MLLAAGFVRECLEHPERGLAETQREPRRRPRLPLDEGQARLEQRSTSSSFPGLASSRTSSPSLTILRSFLSRYLVGSEPCAPAAFRMNFGSMEG